MGLEGVVTGVKGAKVLLFSLGRGAPPVLHSKGVIKYPQLSFEGGLFVPELGQG